MSVQYTHTLHYSIPLCSCRPTVEKVGEDDVQILVARQRVNQICGTCP